MKYAQAGCPMIRRKAHALFFIILVSLADEKGAFGAGVLRHERVFS